MLPKQYKLSDNRRHNSHKPCLPPYESQSCGSNNSTNDFFITTPQSYRNNNQSDTKAIHMEALINPPVFLSPNSLSQGSHLDQCRQPSHGTIGHRLRSEQQPVLRMRRWSCQCRGSLHAGCSVHWKTANNSN